MRTEKRKEEQYGEGRKGDGEVDGKEDGGKWRPQLLLFDSTLTHGSQGWNPYRSMHRRWLLHTREGSERQRATRVRGKGGGWAEDVLELGLSVNWT